MSDSRVSSPEKKFFSAMQRLSVLAAVASVHSAEHVGGSPFLPALSHI